jgi:hypothetical protein
MERRDYERQRVLEFQREEAKRHTEEKRNQKDAQIEQAKRKEEMILQETRMEFERKEKAAQGKLGQFEMRRKQEAFETHRQAEIKA